jgi:hypothetical protein
MEYFDMGDQTKIEIALEKAAEKIIGAVADSFSETATATGVATGAGAGTGQASAGAQGTGGGAVGETGQSTQGSAGEIKTKDDVGGPEVIESLNVQALKDVTIANKMMVDSYGARIASNNKLFDLTATALGFATLGAGHNQSLHQQMGTDHRDQNHDRQINVNETDAYSVLAIASAYERLRNPTPAA